MRYVLARKTEDGALVNSESGETLLYTDVIEANQSAKRLARLLREPMYVLKLITMAVQGV